MNECHFNGSCGGNAFCVNSFGGFECFCLDNYTGNPYTGCDAMEQADCGSRTCNCLSDEECSEEFICVNEKCERFCSWENCDSKPDCGDQECHCTQVNERNNTGCFRICTSDLQCKSNEVCRLLKNGIQHCVPHCANYDCGKEKVCET